MIATHSVQIKFKRNSKCWIKSDLRISVVWFSFHSNQNRVFGWKEFYINCWQSFNSQREIPLNVYTEPRIVDSSETVSVTNRVESFWQIALNMFKEQKKRSENVSNCTQECSNMTFLDVHLWWEQTNKVHWAAEKQNITMNLLNKQISHTMKKQRRQ